MLGCSGCSVIRVIWQEQSHGYSLHLGDLVWCQSLTPRKQYEHSIHLQISKGKAEIDLIIMQIAAVFWVPFMMHSQSQQQISGLTINELL